MNEQSLYSFSMHRCLKLHDNVSIIVEQYIVFIDKYVQVGRKHAQLFYWYEHAIREDGVTYGISMFSSFAFPKLVLSPQNLA